jgi:hypothetical protein
VYQKEEKQRKRHEKMRHTEKSSEIVCRLRPASMIVANLYKIREIIPADIAPRSA